MTTQFDELFEHTFPTSLKLIKRTIYPKEMQFSEEFVDALKKEYVRLKGIGNEGELRPINNLNEKFVKAVDFRLKGFDSTPEEHTIDEIPQDESPEHDVVDEEDAVEPPDLEVVRSES